MRERQDERQRVRQDLSDERNRIRNAGDDSNQERELETDQRRGRPHQDARDEAHDGLARDETRQYVAEFVAERARANAAARWQQVVEGIPDVLALNEKKGGKHERRDRNERGRCQVDQDVGNGSETCVHEFGGLRAHESIEVAARILRQIRTPEVVVQP